MSNNKSNFAGLVMIIFGIVFVVLALDVYVAKNVGGFIRVVYWLVIAAIGGSFAYYRLILPMRAKNSPIKTVNASFKEIDSDYPFKGNKGSL